MQTVATKPTAKQMLAAKRAANLIGLMKQEDLLLKA